MAVTKEAIAIVLDVGSSMQSYDKESPSVLENAKSCINMIIQRKIFSESKDEVALILFGTTETSNMLADDCKLEYSNISIIQDLKPANWELLEYVNQIKGTDIPTEYIRDYAFYVAIDLLQNALNVKKFLSKRILFLSCFDDKVCSEEVTKICESLTASKIDLNIIGPVALSDEEVSDGNCMQVYQNSGPVKSGENTIQRILREVNGESYSFSEALPALIYYQKKKVQNLPWNANLDIGTNLTIPISAYIKVKENKPHAWKNAYARKLNAKLERGVTYLKNEETQTKVSKEDVIAAFKYGTTLVPFSDEDKLNMDYQSGEKGMKVLGFTRAEHVQRYHFIGDKSMYVFGQKNRELAGVILAPFIQALNDTKMVAIVRYVYSPKSAPKIGFLSPRIKANYECLVFIALPFMEDLRHFMFAKLDADPRNYPTEEQLNAVDDLITSMDLSKGGEDEGEDLKPKKTCNPYLQRLYQCLQYRAFHPEKPLPNISPQIEAIVNPSARLVKTAEPALQRIKAVFPLKGSSQKKTVETAVSFFGNSESTSRKRKSCDDVDNNHTISDAISDKITKVGSIHPVRDFQYLINSRTLSFSEASKQMFDVVYSFLQADANLKLYHSKIIAICKELRYASKQRNDATQYNSFMSDLQMKLVAYDPELWNKIKREKVGLISRDEVKSSSVSPMEAEKFLATNCPEDTKDFIKTLNMNEEDENYDDLLDQL